MDENELNKLYGNLSAKITEGVTAHEIGDVPKYFEGLRAIIRCVVNETAESGLSEDEKQELIGRLLAHVSSLEEWWAKLSLRDRSAN